MDMFGDIIFLKQVDNIFSCYKFPIQINIVIFISSVHLQSVPLIFFSQYSCIALDATFHTEFHKKFIFLIIIHGLHNFQCHSIFAMLRIYFFFKIFQIHVFFIYTFHLFRCLLKSYQCKYSE